MASVANKRMRFVHHERDLSLREDGSLRMVAVADTHSAPHPKIAGWIEALAPDAILHGGDIGDLAVLDQLAKLAPVIAVRGNIDPTRSRSTSACAARAR
jgi:predicted phosphodiesterase